MKRKGLVFVQDDYNMGEGRYCIAVDRRKTVLRRFMTAKALYNSRTVQDRIVCLPFGEFERRLEAGEAIQCAGYFAFKENIQESM